MSAQIQTVHLPGDEPQPSSWPADVRDQLTEAQNLRERIAELETELAGARAYAETRREMQVDAESSRDQWIAVAKGSGVVLGKTQGLGDPWLSVRAAHRAVDRHQRRVDVLEREIAERDRLLDGLVNLVVLLPRLPQPVAKLHPDVVHAVHWALLSRTQQIYFTGRPALPVEVIAQVVARHQDDVAFLTGAHGRATTPMHPDGNTAQAPPETPPQQPAHAQQPDLFDAVQP